MNHELPEVTVEFYAVPRLRTGRASMNVRAATLTELLKKIDESCPKLLALSGDRARLNPQYLLSLNGRRFMANLDEPLRAGDRVLLLSADAGG